VTHGHCGDLVTFQAPEKVRACRLEHPNSMCVCVCACVHACVRACGQACVHVTLKCIFLAQLYQSLSENSICRRSNGSCHVS